MERHNYIPLLGLALRGARLAVGAEAVEEAARKNAARLILLSRDASERTRKTAVYLAESGHCLLLTLPDDKAALGQGLGRASASVMALTDAGLATAAGERLAAADPEQYGEAAERLRLKSRRAKERRTSKERRIKQDGRHTGKKQPVKQGRKEPGRERRAKPGNQKRHTGKEPKQDRKKPGKGAKTG